MFTVPAGGDGIFHFSAYLLVEQAEAAVFDMMLNDEKICSAFGDHNTMGDHDPAPASCGAVINAAAGNVNV